jgi:hypothetical protein
MRGGMGVSEEKGWSHGSYTSALNIPAPIQNAFAGAESGHNIYSLTW